MVTPLAIEIFSEIGRGGDKWQGLYILRNLREDNFVHYLTKT
jgi:hypothetical protein